MVFLLYKLERRGIALSGLRKKALISAVRSCIDFLAVLLLSIVRGCNAMG